MRKKLAIEESEADVVRLAYRPYLDGLDGRVPVIKEISKHLSTTGHLAGGKPWTIQKVHVLLADAMYMGMYYFNVRDSKAKVQRPPEEWVTTDIPPITDAATFERVRLIRESCTGIRCGTEGAYFADSAGGTDQVRGVQSPHDDIYRKVWGVSV
jgi:hypothetical protein